MNAVHQWQLHRYPFPLQAREKMLVGCHSRSCKRIAVSGKPTPCMRASNCHNCSAPCRCSNGALSASSEPPRFNSHARMASYTRATAIKCGSYPAPTRAAHPQRHPHPGSTFLTHGWRGHVRAVTIEYCAYPAPARMAHPRQYMSRRGHPNRVATCRPTHVHHPYAANFMPTNDTRPA